MFDFSDRVVVVTGATGELGMAAASAFLEAGAKVTCAERSRERFMERFGTALENPDHLHVASVDLNDPPSVELMVAETVSHFGKLDILVNTVGGYQAGTPVHETAVETWDQMMSLNARTAFIASRAVIPHMLKQGRGAIIHIAARPGLVGRARMAAYSASKSAVIRLTESLADELKPDGVRVNCIIPGTLDTPRNRAENPGADPGLWVKLESLAGVILFLASDAARDISGVALPVTGRS